MFMYYSVLHRHDIRADAYTGLLAATIPTSDRCPLVSSALVIYSRSNPKRILNSINHLQPLHPLKLLRINLAMLKITL